MDENPKASSRLEMDSALAALWEGKDKWRLVTIEHRRQILEAAIRNFGNICDEWVDLGLAAKQSIGDPYDAGWEWAAGPMAILRYLNGLRRTLQQLRKFGRLRLPRPIVSRANGQLSTRLYPLMLYERLSTPGVTVDVWMEPGLTKGEVEEGLASSYRDSQEQGEIALILGAGNVSAAPVNDSLTKLFVEQHVVVLKMNPVNEYLGPLVEKAFRPLIDEGFLRVVYGGAVEGEYLCHHRLVDEIHMTGSAQTYEAIVFGTGPDGEERKGKKQPALNKRFTAELGNIGPAIIVPGPWSESDIEYQAEQLTSHLCDDGGYSCARTRVIIQHSKWQHRQQLLNGIRAVLAKVPSRPAFYPGGAKLYQRFLSSHPETEQFGSSQAGNLPWGLVPEIDSRQLSDICFNTEAFCPIMAETALEASSAAEFLDRAVEFANEHLWGTLTATIIVHPHSLKDPAVSAAVERAIESLRYGAVTVNSIPGLPWAITTPPWGSYPGNEPWDIQSGAGFVNNQFMLARPQKVVVRAPFRTWPRPMWFPSRAGAFGRVPRDVVRYELDPSLWRLLKVGWAALRN